MNRRTAWYLICACVMSCAVLNGCFGGKVQAIRSESLQRAETALIRGVRAEQKGNYPEAAALLTEALTFSTSIDDIPGRITALINLARLNRLQHDPQRAEQHIDRALELIAGDSSLFAEAAHEKALIELSKGQPIQALVWARKSVDTESGDQRGSRLNLASRINLELGNRAAADALARRALLENRSSAHAEEEANSLRIMGIVARFAANYAEGERLLLEALSIDKQIGRSGKIAVDLEELAVISQDTGNLKQAARYLERAGDVHGAAGRSQQAVKTLESCAELYARLGDAVKAGEAREKAGHFAVKDEPQKPQNSSATTRPSSNP